MYKKSFKMLSLWVVNLALLLSIIGQVAYAKPQSLSNPWTLDEAVALVDSKHYGQILRVRLVNSIQDVCPLYRVRVLTTKGRVKSYFVDGCVHDFVQAPQPKLPEQNTDKG